MLYGRPTKFVRHVTDESFVIEPQRYSIIPLWYTDSTIQREDQQDVNDKALALGSRISKNKVSQTMSPNNPDIPTHFYWGRVMLSFDDVFSPYVSGKWYNADGAEQNVNSYINIQPTNNFNNVNATDAGLQNQTATLQQIQLDDYFKHFVRISNKMTVYNENYVFGTRWQRVPGKCKRANPRMFFGLWIYNDAPRTATPADNALNYQLEQYFEEWAL